MDVTPKSEQTPGMEAEKDVGTQQRVWCKARGQDCKVKG